MVKCARGSDGRGLCYLPACVCNKFIYLFIYFYFKKRGVEKGVQKGVQKEGPEGRVDIYFCLHPITRHHKTLKV